MQGNGYAVSVCTMHESESGSAVMQTARGDLDRRRSRREPMAYRRLAKVLAHHSGTVKVLHTLRPFAVAMAGAGEFDPFKD